MLAQDQKKLEDALLKLNLVTKDQLDSAKIESVRSGRDLDVALVAMKVISGEDIVKARAISLNVPYIDLRSFKISPEILRYLKKDLAKKYMVVPFGIAGSNLNVAMVDPNNIQAIEFIERQSGMRVTPYMASPEGVKNALDQFQDLDSEVKEALNSIEIEPNAPAQGEEGQKGIGEIVEDAPVTRAVNTILEYAAKSKASDIHIEPWDNSIKVRYRVDGILQETMSLPSHISSALISRIKILSEMKIDEHRVPQDGRFEINIEGQEIDVRVAVSPTVHGEKVVMRLLNKSAGVINLENIGIRGRAMRLIQQGIERPHGMVLSTGPTGSGKTTTLYAVLTKLNTTSVNIVTLEDPVEYQVNGVNQIQINSSVGLTFAAGLRSILRQDPNIIMVGEIRDSETADLAVQSALTGHMVLSTLHTNNAAGVLPRLLDMKIEPFLIASTVSTVIGQRLVRKLCDKCKKEYTAGPALVKTISQTLGNIMAASDEVKKNLGYTQVPKSNADKFQLWEAVGCDQCNGSGYSGRFGIFEVFSMSPQIETLLVQHATASDIQNETIKEGMITMRQDGFLKALEGITTIEEVITKASEA
jgi:type IV pilus assembly protein PilB